MNLMYKRDQMRTTDFKKTNLLFIIAVIIENKQCLSFDLVPYLIAL